MNNERRCGWCRFAIGTTSLALVYCSEEDRQVFRDSSCAIYVREPGADCDLEELEK